MHNFTLFSSGYFLSDIAIIFIVIAILLVASGFVAAIVLLVRRYKHTRADLAVANTKKMELEIKIAETEKKNGEPPKTESKTAESQDKLSVEQKQTDVDRRKIKKLEEELNNAKSDLTAITNKFEVYKKQEKKNKVQLKKSISDNEEKATALSGDLDEAKTTIEQLRAEIEKYEKERRPSDIDFEMRWKEYDCLLLLYGILNDASTATSADYMKEAIERSIIEIREIIR